MCLTRRPGYHNPARIQEKLYNPAGRSPMLVRGPTRVLACTVDTDPREIRAVLDNLIPTGPLACSEAGSREEAHVPIRKLSCATFATWVLVLASGCSDAKQTDQKPSGPVTLDIPSAPLAQVGITERAGDRRASGPLLRPSTPSQQKRPPVPASRPRAAGEVTVSSSSPSGACELSAARDEDPRTKQPHPGWALCRGRSTLARFAPSPHRRRLATT